MLGALLFLVGLGGPTLPLFEQVQVRRVRLPVYLSPARPDACRDVAASSIVIREDGLELQALHLDSERLPAEHALLLDSSESMLERLTQVKQATIAYAMSLPAAEAALVASFDDDLILHSPMSTDRESLRRRVEAMSVGWQTHLWDALRQMIGYLESRQRRAVLIVLSDGCDTDTGAAGGYDQVIEVAARVPALTVYTIGLDLPARCEGTSIDPRAALKGLARSTGGEHIEIESPAEMKEVLERIRRRFGEERFVSYAPPPFGEGPQDRSGVETKRWRRIELALRGHPRCQLRSAAGALRLEMAPASEPDEAARDAFLYDPDAQLLRGKLNDVVRDRGVLAGRSGLKVFGERVHAQRSVAAPVLPLGQAAWPGAVPEYSLFPALTQLTSEPGISTWTDAGFLISGHAVLEQRLALGVALAGRPDYREWATDHLRVRRLQELDDLQREHPSAADLTALRAIRDYISGPDWKPRPDELVPYLSEWLGDLPALQLHRAAEPWLIGHLLRDAVSPQDVEQSEQTWRDIGFLLGEQSAVRTFGLLVPGYDARQDRIGFFRIVLPRPTTLIHAWHLSPDAPRGLRLLLWALRDPAFREAFAAAPFEVVRVRYGYAPAVPEILELAGLGPLGETAVEALRVQVELVTRDEARERVELGAVFGYRTFAGVPTTEPVCIEVDRASAVGPRAARLQEALVEAMRGHALPCVVAREALERH